MLWSGPHNWQKTKMGIYQWKDTQKGTWYSNKMELCVVDTLEIRIWIVKK